MIRIAVSFVIIICCVSHRQTKNISPCGAFYQDNQQWDENDKANSNWVQTTKTPFSAQAKNMPLRISRLKKFGTLYHRQLWHKDCNQRILFLPLTIQHLKFPTFEILPNHDVCVNGERLRNVCMPRDPLLYEVKIENKVWSLFITSDLIKKNPKKQALP